MLFISRETEDLIRSIVNDDGWKQVDQYTFGNDKSEIWTSNGVLFIDFYPSIGAFNIIEKIAIKSAIKKRTIMNAIAKDK